MHAVIALCFNINRLATAQHNGISNMYLMNESINNVLEKTLCYTVNSSN